MVINANKTFKIMKKLAILSAIFLSGALLTNNADAQVRINVGFNLGGPHIVAPYSHVNDYYYLPEVDAYYSVGEEQYYYNDGYSWVSAAYLPGAYRNYNWRTARRYEVNAYRPYMNHRVYRERFHGSGFDWRRYNNNNRDFDRNDHREWNNGRDRDHDNRPDWNGRDGRPDQRNDNRGNDNRGRGNNQWPSQPGRGENRPSQNDGRGNGQWPSQPGRGENRPSQNDNRGGSRDGRPNFADNNGNGNGFGHGRRS